MATLSATCCPLLLIKILFKIFCVRYVSDVNGSELLLLIITLLRQVCWYGLLSPNSAAVVMVHIFAMGL